MPLITDVFNSRPDTEFLGYQSRVGRLLWLPTRRRPVLADVVEVESTVGVGPEPSLGAVEPATR